MPLPLHLPVLLHSQLPLHPCLTLLGVQPVDHVSVAFQKGSPPGARELGCEEAAPRRRGLWRRHRCGSTQAAPATDSLALDGLVELLRGLPVELLRGSGLRRWRSLWRESLAACEQALDLMKPEQLGTVYCRQPRRRRPPEIRAAQGAPLHLPFLNVPCNASQNDPCADFNICTCVM